MAFWKIPKKFENQEIKIPVRTKTKTRIVCRASHPSRPNTVYFDVAPVITGEDAFVVKIPKMPEAGVVLEVYNEANGHVKGDTSFQVQQPKVAPLKQSFAIAGILDPNVAKFARFIDDFADKAGVISARNDIYVSPDGKFRIHYKEVIRDEQGRELRTPLRVNSKTKEMEIAKSYYKNYTVPGRKMWAWHEFSHVWKNVNPADELEADKNAIMIYLGFGNPIAEAYKVTLEVFKNTPSDLNRERYEALNEYIQNFNKEVQKQIN